jgi:hypothetical protein
VTHIFYYLTITPAAAAQGDILLNGFPLARDPIPARAMWMDMVNLHLTGASNSLQLRLRLEAAGATVRLQLRRFREGMVVTPEDGEPVQLSGAIQGPDGSVVLTASEDRVIAADLRFNSPEFDFSEIYRSAPAVDPAAAAAFAQEVAQALVAGNLGPLMEGSGDRIGDLARAFGRPVSDIRAAVEAEYGEMAASGLRPVVVDKTLSFAGGRLVEPVPYGEEPLLRTRPDNPEPIEARLFVGLRRGRLQIVR